MATNMMEVDRPTIPSDPWENEHILAAGVNKLVDEQTEQTGTTNEKSSTTIPPQPKRQRDNNYSPNESLTVFNNGIISSSSSSVAPFKNSGGRPDWESPIPPPPPDHNYSKLLHRDKAAEYNSIRDRLDALVKLSLGISDDMRNKAPPLRDGGEYINKDTAADAFLLLMNRLSLNDIPPEQRKGEAKRLLGAVSNMIDDCDDIDKFFGGGGGGSGGGGGGDLVVPSSTLSTSTGNINSTSDVGVFDSTSAAVPSSCTTSDTVIDSKVDLVLSVAPCPEGNNSLTDDKLVLASNSELRATEKISSTMDEGTITASSVVEEEERVSTQEDVEFESGGDWQPDDLVETGSDITTSVPTHLTAKTLATKWRKNIIKEIYDIDKVKENIDNFSKLKTKDRLSNYSPIDQIKVQQLTLLTAHHHKLGLPNQELNEKMSKVLEGHIYYEGEFEEEMRIIRQSAEKKIAQEKEEMRHRFLAELVDIEKMAGVDYFAGKMEAEKTKSEVIRVMDALVLNVVKVVEDGQHPTSTLSTKEKTRVRNRLNQQACRRRKKQTNQENETFVNVLRNEQLILLQLARAANESSPDDDASTEVKEFMKRGSLEDIPSVDSNISESEIGIPLPERGSTADAQNRINSRRTRRRRKIKTKRVTDMIKQLGRENTLLLEYSNRLLAKSTTKANYQTTTVEPGSLFLTVEIGKKEGAKITNVQTKSPLRSVVSENDIIISVNGKLVQKREDIAQNCVRRLVILNKEQ